MILIGSISLTGVISSTSSSSWIGEERLNNV